MKISAVIGRKATPVSNAVSPSVCRTGRHQPASSSRARSSASMWIAESDDGTSSGPAHRRAALLQFRR
jgi:hypothetical protein